MTTPDIFQRVLDLRHWTSGNGRKNHDCKCEDCKAIKQVVHLARQAVEMQAAKKRKS